MQLGQLDNLQPKLRALGEAVRARCRQSAEGNVSRELAADQTSTGATAFEEERERQLKGELREAIETQLGAEVATALIKKDLEEFYRAKYTRILREA